MLPRDAWHLLLACLLASLAACAPIGFGRQELLLHHDAKADALELMIVYDAIQSNRDDAEVPRGFATRVSGGKREFMIFDWPMHFDLELIQKSVEDSDKQADAWQDWARELVGGFSSVGVADSGYFTDSAGRPGLHQCLRISDAARWMSRLERALYIAIEESSARGSFEKEFDWLDARTRELWLAMAKEKRSWLWIKDGTLTVDLPATAACASRVLAELMQASAGEQTVARFYAGLASHLSLMKIADERVVLGWKLAGPTFTFEPSRDQPYSSRLAQSLRDSKSLPETLPSREEVVAAFLER